MHRLILVAAFALAGCHGIEHPTAPTSTTATVAPTAIVLVAMPAQLPAGGGTSTIDVTVSPTDGQPATVTLTSSTGTLAHSSIVTDATGHARVEWTGDRSSAIGATLGGLGGSVTVSVAGGAAPPAPPTPNPNPGPNPTPTPNPTPGGTITVGIAAGPSPAYAGEMMRFSAVIQTAPPVSVTSIVWAFDDGGQATGRETERTFGAWGQRTASVVVLTADGRRGEASIRFTVRPQDDFELSDMAAEPDSASVGEAVRWSVRVAAHNGNPPTLVYRWDFDGNGTVDATTTVPSATTAYLTVGTRTARVTAAAADGRTSSASGTVEVSDPK